MDNITKKMCETDNECNKNELCTFNETDLNNYCISTSIENNYIGCLDNRNINYESIESKIPNQTYMDCINFTRKQTNNDNLPYNYMLFRPEIKTYVDTTTIVIYLKYNDEIVAVIPYEDYFILKCDNNRNNCILESKDSLYRFIKQNIMEIRSVSPNDKIIIEIIYECENEGLKKIEKIPIDITIPKKLMINLTCPINPSNSLLKSKCESLFVEDNNELKLRIDTKKIINDCNNPLFKIPTIIKDKRIYKKVNDKRNQKEILNYDEKIEQKQYELKLLEAEKYIKLKKIQNGQNIPLEEAMEKINNLQINKMSNWKIFKNYDAAEKLFEYQETNVQVLKYYGKVYTIQDAIDAANKNNELFFVWYHNSFELDEFASKLYFIDIYSLDENILNKENWVKSENVSTGLMKITIENYDDYENEDIMTNDYEMVSVVMGDVINNEQSNFVNELITELNEIDTSHNNNLDSLKSTMNSYIEQSANINENIIKNLNNKITTYSQAISNNDYEEQINNNILFYLIIVMGVLILILVSLIVYYNILVNRPNKS